MRQHGLDATYSYFPLKRMELYAQIMSLSIIKLATTNY
ncbi:MAG: hypothetical protein QOH25_2088 [Acidobacteriota bacterium]|jgi:hypothetical protein|nr:hypothetical protein [Acidobacteriota bacterium]